MMTPTPLSLRRAEGMGFAGHGLWSLLLACVAVSPLPAQDHWYLRPLTRPTVPEGTNAVDFFIGEALAEKNLKQNEAADLHTLLRRATLDLTGLPPTPEEIAAFETESIQNPKSAFPNLTDRLLASPHYG